MSITNVSVISRLRVLVSRSASDNCAPPQEEIWFPVAPTVTQLPPAPAEVINLTPIPADSADLPEDFDVDNPDLCLLFTSILSERNDPVYEIELEAPSLVLPYNETVVRVALLRTYFELYRFNYSLKPRLQNVSLVGKVKSTSVRTYKFKKASLALSASGQDATIRPTRAVIAAKGSLSLVGSSATLKPIKLFGDTGSFVTSFSAASVAVPGTFSYGWASTTETGVGQASPINIGYRRNIHISLYSPTIMLANGARAGGRIVRLRWYITGAISPNYSILGMNIRLFHTTATNTSGNVDPVSGTTRTTVYSDASTVEFTKAETTGVLTIEFPEPFTWNGTNSLVVESCTSQNQTNYASQGSMRNIVTGSTGVRKYSWTDNAGSSCSSTPGSVLTDQIAVQMDFI